MTAATADEVDRIVDLYAELRSMKLVAQQVGRSVSHVHLHLRARGVETPQGSERLVSDQALTDAYATHLTVTGAALAVGLSSTTVRKRLRGLGLLLMADEARAERASRASAKPKRQPRPPADPEARRAAKAASYQRNKHKRVARGRDAHLRRTFGLSAAEYDAMLAAQGGGCAVCGALPTTKSLPVDHAHDTGLVRGVLCDPCNRGLGSFRDRPDLLRAAADYLERTTP